MSSTFLEAACQRLADTEPSSFQSAVNQRAKDAASPPPTPLLSSTPPSSESGDEVLTNELKTSLEEMIRGCTHRDDRGAAPALDLGENDGIRQLGTMRVSTLQAPQFMAQMPNGELCFTCARTSRLCFVSAETWQLR